MTRRFTETNKWEDKWYRKLPLAARELFNFLCDKCDVAGFWQVDLETAAFFVGIPEKEGSSLGQHPGESCEAAIEVLIKRNGDGEIPHVLLSEDRAWLYVTNFLPQQGNWPIPNNQSLFLGIRRAFLARKVFGEYALRVLCEKTLQTIPAGFLEGGLTLNRGSNDPLGKGNGNGKDLQEEECRGETGLAAAVAAWNTTVPAERAVEKVTGVIQRAYASCAAHDPPITDAEICDAIANYGKALALPDSQAGEHTLGKFLAGLGTMNSTSKYLSGTFNLRDFSQRNFKSRDGPSEYHPCVRRGTLNCTKPGIHRVGNGSDAYWTCEDHKPKGAT